MSIKGKIHSLESFGAADGPGVRFVVFLKGCNMRCKYCHNPDSWADIGNTEMDSDDLINKIKRYKSYWGKDGGITVSGGEPLLQIDFVTELFEKAKQEDIHTAIDTAGEPFVCSEEFMIKFDELMKYTDLVILDIKHIDDKKHRELTGKTNKNILEMAQYLSEIKKPVWIRHVLVPGYTDFDEDLDELGKFIFKLKNVEKTEILPYHSLGVFKWEKLGLKYELEGVLSPSEDIIQNACKRLNIC